MKRLMPLILFIISFNCFALIQHFSVQACSQIYCEPDFELGKIQNIVNTQIQDKLIQLQIKDIKFITSNRNNCCINETVWYEDGK